MGQAGSLSLRRFLLNRHGNSIIHGVPGLKSALSDRIAPAYCTSP
jgi:hypothetical protein